MRLPSLPYVLGAVAAMALCAAPAGAQVKAGPEFRANSFTTELSGDPPAQRATRRRLRRGLAELRTGRLSLRRLRAAVRARWDAQGRRVPGQYVHRERSGPPEGGREQGREVRGRLAERRPERGPGRLRPALRRLGRASGGRVPGQHGYRRRAVRPRRRHQRPGRLRRHLDQHVWRRIRQLRHSRPALRRHRRAPGRGVLREYLHHGFSGPAQRRRHTRRPLRSGVGEPGR